MPWNSHSLAATWSWAQPPGIWVCEKWVVRNTLGGHLIYVFLTNMFVDCGVWTLLVLKQKGWRAVGSLDIEVCEKNPAMTKEMPDWGWKGQRSTDWWGLTLSLFPCNSSLYIFGCIFFFFWTLHRKTFSGPFTVIFLYIYFLILFLCVRLCVGQ